MPEQKHIYRIKTAAYKEGVLDQRLTGIDKNIATINGSVERTAVELNRLRELIEEQLSGKADRVRVHEMIAEVATIKLEIIKLEHEVIKREGPIANDIERNSRRLDVLEAIQPIKGLLRVAAAAGSSFAVVLGVIYMIMRILGLV